MNVATYTKIVKSENYNDLSMSLGFRRYFCLPSKVKMNIKVKYLIDTGSSNSHDFVVNFFAEMTEQEYKNYIATH